MVNENEIRIGNCFHHNDGWSYRSNDLKPFNFTWDSRDWYALGECTLSLEDIFPIAVTHEILEKAGFRMGGDKVWSSGKYEIEIVEENDGYHVVINREYPDGKPKLYLHELQNVSFALYGEEIEISL